MWLKMNDSCTLSLSIYREFSWVSISFLRSSNGYRRMRPNICSNRFWMVSITCMRRTWLIETLSWKTSLLAKPLPRMDKARTTLKFSTSVFRWIWQSTRLQTATAELQATWHLKSFNDWMHLTRFRAISGLLELFCSSSWQALLPSGQASRRRFTQRSSRECTLCLKSYH